jgi:hypothetical protein
VSHLKTSVAILKSILCWTGSQWRRARTGEIDVYSIFSLLNGQLSFVLAAAERYSFLGVQYRKHKSSNEIRRDTGAVKLPKSYDPTQMEIAPFPSRSNLVFECQMTDGP